MGYDSGMPSILFPSKEPIVSLAFYEAVSIAAAGNPNAPLFETLKEASELLETKLSTEDLAMIAERFINESALKQLTEKSGPSPKRRGKQFGTGFLDWVGSFDGTQICLFLADYQLEEAKRLYREVDRKEIEKLIEEKSSYTWQQAVLSFESVLFGMGGHYDGSSPNDKIIDLTEDPIPKHLLKNLGVMH